MSKAFQTHIDAIRSGRVEKRNIAGLRKAFNADARRGRGRSTGATAPKATPEQLDEASECVTQCRPLVVGALHDSGLVVIRSKRNRRNLESVADLVPHVVRFRLVQFEMWGQYGDYFVPVYRAETEDGRGFRFVNVPWQSGGRGPQIVGA